MKVATWRGGSRFTLDEAPEPVAGPGQVVVDVAAAGICGTDVHATQGLFPWTPPMVLGHEYSGVVREVGRGVNRRLIGQAVACEPSFGCGTCLPCRNRRISQCAKATRVGGFAERAALPLDCVHPLPRGLDPVTAALAEPASCCLSGLEMFRMPRNATVVVMGGGIMGLLTMVLARRRGAGRLILSDPLEERRQIASKLGARVVVDPARESLHDRVMELTGGHGAEVVCEAVGKPELVGEAFALVKPTGVLQLVGVNPKGSRMPMDLFDIHFREIRIHGAYGRGTAFRRALALLPKLGVKRLIGARFPLARIEDAFAHAAARARREDRHHARVARTSRTARLLSKGTTSIQSTWVPAGRSWVTARSSALSTTTRKDQQGLGASAWHRRPPCTSERARPSICSMILTQDTSLASA